MGGIFSSETVSQNTKIQNDILQVSQQKCNIVCANDLSNTTMIFTDVTGDITISQECLIENPECTIKTAFEASIENILKTVAEQKQTISGETWGQISSADLNVDITSVIQNFIGQIIESTCNVESKNTMNNNYIVVQRANNFTISQKGAITGASCTLDAVAHARTYNEQTVEAKQTQTVTSTIAVIAIAIIALIIFAFLGKGKGKNKEKK